MGSRRSRRTSRSRSCHPRLRLPTFTDLARPYLDPREEMRMGVMTDRRLRPLLEDGSVPHTNLYAAGSMLGGYDYSGPCGFGVPILTGWLAGRNAARQGQ